MAELGTANIGGRAVPAWVLESTAEQVDNSKWFSRPNLLYNWYFVGGGSQQGGGQFPINQKGQTSYQNDGSTIDRWAQYASSGATATVTLESGGIRLSCQGSESDYFSFRKIIPKNAIPVGGKITLSTLVDGELYTATRDVGTLQIFLESGTLNRIEFSSLDDSYYYVQFIVVSGSSFLVQAAKLEFGPTQTLAYQDEDGNWQLLEMPDFQEELAKCQAYLRTYDVVWATAPSTASEYLQIQAVYEPMAGVPTITVGSIANFGGTEQPGLSVVSTQKSENAWWIVKLNQSVSANTMLQLKDVFLEAPI